VVQNTRGGVPKHDRDDGLCKDMDEWNKKRIKQTEEWKCLEMGTRI